MSWGGSHGQVIDQMQVTVEGGITLVEPPPSAGYDYHELNADPQAVVFIDENGTPRLDVHRLPVGQSPSDGTPRLVVP